jgi:hypothetical protein
MCAIQFGAINPERPVRIVYLLEEITAQYLPNTILECYHYTTCWTSDVLAIVGAFHGILPHVANSDNRSETVLI